MTAGIATGSPEEFSISRHGVYDSVCYDIQEANERNAAGREDLCDIVAELANGNRGRQRQNLAMSESGDVQ